MWKSLKSVLKDSGVICNSPKSCFKKAFNQGWVQDEGLWLDMLQDRNLTTHIYDEALAEKVYQRLDIYHQAMANMLGCIKK